MQSKRYAISRESTVASGGIDTITIQNDTKRRANYHGIRWSGRLRADNASADNEAHGFFVLLCRSAAFASLGEANYDTADNLEDQSGIIMIISPWSVFGGSTNPVGVGTTWDWNFEMRTSRTCSANDLISAKIVSLAESAKSVVVGNSLLSCFETVL